MSTNAFCKYEDPTTYRTFVITDKNKQPLSCHDNKCKVGNCKKLVNNPSLYTNVVDRNYFDNTSIVCNSDNDGKVNTYIDTSKYNVASYSGNQNNYYKDIQTVLQSNTLNVSELQQKCDNAAAALTTISTSQVDLPDKPLILRDDIKFCKYKDSDNNKYVITDNHNQPLIADKKNNKCMIVDFKNLIDHPSDITNLYDSKLVKDTNIPCDYSNDGLVTHNFDKNIYKVTTFKGNNESEFYKQYNADILMSGDKFDNDGLKNKHNAATKLFTDEPTAQAKLQSTSTSTSTTKTLDTTSPLFIALVILLIFTLLFIIAMIYLLIRASLSSSSNQ